MKFEVKLKLLLWKYYFDKGFGLTNNIKYIIALFALYETVQLQNIKITVALGGAWAIASFFIGWWWYRKDWNAAELEIANRVNPFVIEMRESLNSTSTKKKHG